MDRIHRLPFITGGFMAVLTGITSYACGSDNQTIYIRMAVVMVVFYIIGIFIRNTLQSISNELDEKKERDLLKEKEEAAAAELAELAEKNAVKQNEAGNGQRVNLVADDSGEEFTPLTVSQVISTQFKE